MSEFLSAAADKMGVPEPLVERAANARAQATGSSVDEVLQAWAGGEAAPSAPAEPEPAPAEPEAAAEPEPEEPEAAPQPEPTPQPTPEPQPAPQPALATSLGPETPPILEGREDRPLAVLVGATALFLITALIGFVAPASSRDVDGVYSSAIPYSQAGVAGRDVYLSEGCASCHTQQVRPVVADVGLGPVTAPDTNQVLGSRRYGPDLAHVGSRLEPAQIAELLTSGQVHPSYAGLASSDLEALVAYLVESR